MDFDSPANTDAFAPARRRFVVAGLTPVIARIGIATPLAFTTRPGSAAPDPQALLAASDAVRNPGQPFSVQLTIVEFDAGRRVDSSSYVTYSRLLADGSFASIVRFTAPARDVGKLMLKSGAELWFYDPSTQASARLSPQQRLIGQAANGDVVTVNLARDYRATLEAEETVSDGERQPRDVWRMRLAAATSDATYHSGLFWLDRGNRHPVKGEFHSASGRTLKTIFYRRFQPHMGGPRPTEMVIIDGLNPQSVTLMRLAAYAPRELPAHWFQRDFLPRFQAD
jgi:hypothetical protein